MDQIRDQVLRERPAGVVDRDGLARLQQRGELAVASVISSKDLGLARPIIYSVWLIQLDVLLFVRTVVLPVLPMLILENLWNILKYSYWKPKTKLKWKKSSSLNFVKFSTQRHFLALINHKFNLLRKLGCALHQGMLIFILEASAQLPLFSSPVFAGLDYFKQTQLIPFCIIYSLIHWF